MYVFVEKYLLTIDLFQKFFYFCQMKKVSGCVGRNVKKFISNFGNVKSHQNKKKLLWGLGMNASPLREKTFDYLVTMALIIIFYLAGYSFAEYIFCDLLH